MTYKFINSTIAVAALATFTTLISPSHAAAQGEDMKYQVYSLQQSLRATNARVDQLEKELTRLRGEITSWSNSPKQVPVSYNSSKQQDRPAPSSQGGSVHHVASGDTLSSLSRRYGLGLDRIVAANPGLDPHRIRIGQPIIIPKSGAGAPAKENAPKAMPTSTGSYEVRAGDTLSSIARRHNTSATQLLALNGLRNPNALSIGQRLTVPGGNSNTSSASNRYGSRADSPAPTPTPAPAPEPEESSSELLTAPEGHGYYQVVRKDTLYSIALSFGTTSRELRRLNKLDGDDELSVGQYLLVPVADESLYES